MKQHTVNMLEVQTALAKGEAPKDQTDKEDDFLLEEMLLLNKNPRRPSQTEKTNSNGASKIDQVRLLFEDLQDQMDPEFSRSGSRGPFPVRLRPMRKEICKEEPLRGAREVARGCAALRLRAMREDLQRIETQEGARQKETSDESERDTNSVRQHQSLWVRRDADRSDEIHSPDAGQLLRVKFSLFLAALLFFCGLTDKTAWSARKRCGTKFCEMSCTGFMNLCNFVNFPGTSCRSFAYF